MSELIGNKKPASIAGFFIFHQNCVGKSFGYLSSVVSGSLLFQASEQRCSDASISLFFSIAQRASAAV